MKNIPNELTSDLIFSEKILFRPRANYRGTSVSYTGVGGLFRVSGVVVVSRIRGGSRDGSLR